MLSQEWRCSWSSADRRCSNYIWVIDDFIGYKDASHIRDFTVVQILHMDDKNHIKTVFLDIGISLLKIRRSQDRLIFNKGIPILVRQLLYIETAPILFGMFNNTADGLAPEGACALFQYPIIRLIVRSRKVSQPQDMYLELHDRSEIWQTPRQHCCRCACQISKRYEYSDPQSRTFETFQDFMIRRLISDIETGPRVLASMILIQFIQNI